MELSDILHFPKSDRRDKQGVRVAKEMHVSAADKLLSVILAIFDELPSMLENYSWKILWCLCKVIKHAKRSISPFLSP